VYCVRNVLHHGRVCVCVCTACWQMIMIVGLPGSGKTTWGLTMVKQYPYKRYNIIGTDTLIEKMRVMGLPRRNNYHGRWEVLIQKATNCLNKLFQIGQHWFTLLGLERYQARHPIPNNIGLSQCQYPIPIPIPVRDETLYRSKYYRC